MITVTFIILLGSYKTSKVYIGRTEVTHRRWVKGEIITLVDEVSRRIVGKKG